MKTKVNLEFLSKVREVNEKMVDLAVFWLDNEEELEDANVSKNHLSREFFRDLAFDTYNWLLALINNYCENEPSMLFEFFNAYYKSLQK